mmetsp:Transcript_51129/g.136244  ORF Transcript_51129/g.136244 Transcript_51129/m.136244 type:complete len:203 (-) Transcript_51129:58-666(-)
MSFQSKLQNSSSMSLSCMAEGTPWVKVLICSRKRSWITAFSWSSKLILCCSPPRVTCQLHQHAIRPKAVEPVMPHHQVTKVGLGQLGIQPIWKLHQEDDRVGMRRPEIVQKACHVPLLFPRPVYGYDQHDLVLLHYLGDAFQLRLSNSDSPSCDGRCEHVDWLLLRAPRHQGPEAKCRRAWCDTDEICLHNPLGRTECCHDV